ncbi:MAG: ribosome silencing factor [Oscillospiraceae bacterium]|nr:ribosome silencing factor [Oscillospiraceae bacterium]
MTANEIMGFAVKTLDDKKARDITVLEVGKLTAICDYFVIASGMSSTQVKTLAEELEDMFSGIGIEPKRVEGEKSAMWVLLDYGDVIVHIFYHETRDFYCLERLWADAPQVDIGGIIAEGD